MNNTTHELLNTLIYQSNITNELLNLSNSLVNNITYVQLEHINTLIFILYVVISLCVFLMFYVFLQILNLVASAAWK